MVGTWSKVVPHEVILPNPISLIEQALFISIHFALRDIQSRQNTVHIDFGYLGFVLIITYYTTLFHS